MIFDKLFTRKEKKILSFLSTDMHSHLIPNIDDGVRDYSEAMSCIREMNQQGLKKIYITPHFQAHKFNNEETDIQNRFEELKKIVKAESIDIELGLGGEYLIDDGFRNRIKNESKLLTINNKYLLIEFPFHQSLIGMEELIFDLQTKGYEIILAHPERYSYLSYNSPLLQHLKEQGVYFQSNILSFGGFYGSTSQQTAYQYVEMGWIDFLGSDMHNKKYREALIKTCSMPKFQKLIKKNTFLNNQL